VALNLVPNDFNHVAATEAAPSRVIPIGSDSVTVARSVVAIMDRDNETWLAQLRGTGPDQQAALSDLREALLRSLRRALSHRAEAGAARSWRTSSRTRSRASSNGCRSSRGAAGS
jgi:hypothetical protein